MKRDMLAGEFEALSNEAKKRYIVSLLIKDSGSKPVPASQSPIAFIMAGVPGAGKTEFVDSLIEVLHTDNQYGEFVRIDLDQIVTIYPDYTPKTYAKFRSRGNHVVARCVDDLRHNRYNMIIDGTFSGKSGSSVRNVEKLLTAGYVVFIMYMYDKPETAWNYTKSREIETKRGIGKDGFIESCKNISINLQIAKDKFKNNSGFRLSVVKQKELRDNNYEFLTKESDIDKLIEQGYNIDKLKETL